MGLREFRDGIVNTVVNRVIGPPDTFYPVSINGVRFWVDSDGKRVEVQGTKQDIKPGETVVFGRNGRHLIRRNETAKIVR